MSTPEAAAPQAASIKPATGKLGVMIPGMGAVATTLIAGVEAVRRNLAKPIGSISQMGTIRLGKRTEANSPLQLRGLMTWYSRAGTSSAATFTTPQRQRRCSIAINSNRSGRTSNRSSRCLRSSISTT